MNTHGSNSFYLTTMAFVASVVLITLAIFGFASSAQAKPKGVYYNDFPADYSTVGMDRGKNARLVQRPTELSWGREASYQPVRYLRKLTWETWGGAVAKGSGIDTRSNNTSIQIRMSNPKKCGPYRMYQRAVVNLNGEMKSIAVKCQMLAIYRNDRGAYEANEKARFVEAGGKYYASVNKWRGWGNFRARATGKIYGPVKVKVWKPIYCKNTGFVTYSRIKVGDFTKSYRSICRNKQIYLPFVPR